LVLLRKYFILRGNHFFSLSKMKAWSFFYSIPCLIKRECFFIGVFLLFLISNLLIAQEFDPAQEDFANNEWYLTKLIIDGEEHPFVPNQTIDQSPLYTDELENQDGNVISGIAISFCADCGTEIEFENNHQFKRGYFTCLAMDYCSYAPPALYLELLDYHALYFYDFWKQNEAPETLLFDFLITEHDNHAALVITNDDGDQAFYGDMPLSVNFKVKSEDIKLYPNPTNDFLYITNLTKPVEIKIFNPSGRVVCSKKANNSTEGLNVAQLAEGMYFYQIRQNGEKVIKTGKLIKN